MLTYILVVTWFYGAATHYQIPFTTRERCEQAAIDLYGQLEFLREEMARSEQVEGVRPYLSATCLVGDYEAGSR
jgi:hypothetical protein